MVDDAYKNRTNWHENKITAPQIVFNDFFAMRKQVSRKAQTDGITIETPEIRHIFWPKSVEIVPYPYSQFYA